MAFMAMVDNVGSAVIVKNLFIGRIFQTNNVENKSGLNNGLRKDTLSGN